MKISSLWFLREMVKHWNTEIKVLWIILFYTFVSVWWWNIFVETMSLEALFRHPESKSQQKSSQAFSFLWSTKYIEGQSANDDGDDDADGDDGDYEEVEGEDDGDNEQAEGEDHLKVLSMVQQRRASMASCHQVKKLYKFPLKKSQMMMIMRMIRIRGRC